MGNSSSSTSSVHQGDVLYTHRMTLLLCGLYYDGKDRMMKKKKVSDGASFDGPNSPNDILLLTTKRSLSCNTRPMIMIYEYLKPAVDIRVMKEIMALREPRCLFFSGIKGHAGQVMLNGAWFRDPIAEHNNSPIYRMKGVECFGHTDMVLFKDTSDRWRMASDSMHRIPHKDICYLLGVKGTKNNESPLGATFKIYDGSNWVVRTGIKCENKSSILDVATNLEAANIQIRKQNEEIAFLRGVEFRNISGIAGQHCLNGFYVLSEDKHMTGRPVYEYANGTRFGHNDIVLFFDAQGRWRIASWNDHVQKQDEICYMMGCGQIGKTPLGGGYWQVYETSQWVTKPKIEIRAMNSDQVEKALQLSKDRVQNAKIEMDKCEGFILQGITGVHKQAQLNGVWVKIPGLMKNGRPVFAFVSKDKCFEKHRDMVLFYDKDGRWRGTSKGEYMDTGVDTCYLMGIGHSRLVPFGDDGKWQTHNNGKWTIIKTPTKVLPLTGKQLEDAKKIMFQKGVWGV